MNQDELRKRFDNWYDKIYPRQKERLAAWKAYVKAVQGGASLDELDLGAEQYAKDQAGEDPKFTKYPATWLNRGCWSDKPDKQRDSFDREAAVKAWDIRARQQATPSDDVRCPPRKDH